MKKQAVLVQIIFSLKLPKAGIGGNRKGDRSVLYRHPLRISTRSIENLQVRFPQQSFSGQPHRSVGG